MAVWGPFSFLSVVGGAPPGAERGHIPRGIEVLDAGPQRCPRGAGAQVSYFFNANLVFEKAQRRPTVGVQRSIFAPDCWIDLKS